MTLTPSGNKHRKHNCLLTGRQISAEAGIFDANRCRQSRGQVRNRGRDHLNFAARASTVLSEAWGERNPAKKIWKSYWNDNQKYMSCMMTRSYPKELPKTGFQALRTFNYLLLCHSQTQRSNKAASINKLRPVGYQALPSAAPTISLLPLSPLHQCTGIYSALNIANGKQVSWILPTLSAKHYSSWPYKGICIRHRATQPFSQSDSRMTALGCKK